MMSTRFTALCLSASWACRAMSVLPMASSPLSRTRAQSSATFPSPKMATLSICIVRHHDINLSDPIRIRSRLGMLSSVCLSRAPWPPEEHPQYSAVSPARAQPLNCSTDLLQLL